jgi:hypothetical protein
VSRRGARVPRPASGDQWTLRFSKAEAAKDWELACNQFAENAARAFDWLTQDPRRHDARNHRLRGELGTGTHRGHALERWQYELTAAARVWFLVEDAARTVWIEAVYLGHPKQTERR